LPATSKIIGYSIAILFKIRSGVAHVAMAPLASGQQAATGLRLIHCVARLVLSSPLPLFLPFPPSRLSVGVDVGVGVVEGDTFGRRRRRGMECKGRRRGMRQANAGTVAFCIINPSDLPRGSMRDM
jgi:hypothetical protein